MSKFLNYEDRLLIEKGLNNQDSFGDIGKSVGKDRTTIAKEVKKYAYEQKTGYSNYPYNPCKHRKTCTYKKLCQNKCDATSKYKCSLCIKCTSVCPDFIEEICSARNKPPYVCNGCADYKKCTLKKYIYNAENAHQRFSEHLSESRTGILCDEAEIARLNAIITPLIRKGQSPHQIYINHVDELMCSEKTLYNYIDARLFDVRNIDLPRKVRYRPRYKQPEFKVDRACRTGRTYQDFLSFMEAYPDTCVVQMDSVIGEVGGKLLLTIHFVNTSLMLAFLRDANTSQSVIDIFNLLDKILGPEMFNRLFPVLLGDNGSEFSNPKAIEYRDTWHMNSLHRTNVFYCDPSCPYEKGAIEVNHELIRRILPKGTSFNHLTQNDIFLMMDHINSYKRKKLNNRSPYEAFSFYYGEDVLKRLGCRPIAADDIILKPSLLKK